MDWEKVYVVGFSKWCDMDIFDVWEFFCDGVVVVVWFD